MKKGISLLVALLLVLSASIAAAGGVSQDSFPIVQEPITLTAFGTAGPYTKGDFNDLKIWAAMEELTNIKIEFDYAPSGQSGEKLGLLFASNTLPNIIFKTGISNADVTNYAEEGQLVAIDGYLDEYAPNFTTILTETPEVRKAIVMADGHIYGFSYLVTASPAVVSPKLFYNEQWAKANDLAPAATLEELAEQARLFKDSDWNGNGVADEIGIADADGMDYLLNAFAGSFGLRSRGSGSSKWDIDGSGALRYIPVADEYRDMIEYIAGMYAEGLIDPEIFTVDLANFQAKAEQNLVGFAFIHNNNYLGTYKNDYAGLPAPLLGPTGELLYSGVTLSVSSGNTFITNTCENVEAAVRYIDYFYSEDGITLYFMGIEGETFEYDASGNPQFTDLVTNNPDGMSMEEALGTYVCWSGGGNPSVADDLHFGNHLIPEITVTAAQNLKAYEPEIVWPASFTYTAEETERMTDLALDINTYANDMLAKFITGNESFDNWDAYVATIINMGLEEYQAIVQAGMERFDANA